MPTYEYRCTECGQLIEAFQRMSDAPLTTCPSCQKEGLKRLVSGGAGVLYKGEGWYVTDYSKTSTGGKDTPAGTTPARSGETSTGNKPSSKPETKPSTDTNGPGPLPKTGT